MIRSRATHNLRTLRLVLALVAVPGGSLLAQAGLTHLDDATMVPKGDFRLSAVSAWDRFNSLFSPPGAAKPTIPLGAGFSFDSLGVTQLPALAGTQNAIQSLTGSPFRLTLGSMQAAADARVSVTPISLEYGLARRLTLGVMLPLVRTRMSIMLRVNPNGNEGNVGINPASVSNTALLQDSLVVRQMSAAAATLQATLQACQADSTASANCSLILGRQQDVATLLQSAAQFETAFGSVYGASHDARGAAVVPLAGSAADDLVKLHLAAYDSSFRAFLSGGPLITATPAAAGGVVGTNDLAALLHEPGIAGFDSLQSTVRIAAGDVELSARFLLFDGFADSTASPGLRSRATLTGTYRLPTGQLSLPSNPLDIATGHGTSAAGARLAWYTQWGRVGLAATGSYVESFGKTKTGPLPLAYGAPFPPSTADIYPYTPGPVMTFTVAPRIMITRLMGVNALYDYQHVAANTYTSSFASSGSGTQLPITPMAEVDGIATAPGTLQAAGFGITYSTVSEYDRGKAALPIDVTFTHLEAISGAERMPKFFRDQIQIRLYYRRGRR